MRAKQKLNLFHFYVSLALAGLAGLLIQSGQVFVLVFLLLLACALGTRGIRR